MIRSKPILAGLVLTMILLVAGTIHHMKAHQRLGAPGLKTRPMADSQNLEILLPESVPGWTSLILTNSETLLKQLPQDTSFRVRLYQQPTNEMNWMQMTAVMMGADRTSIHSPYICMTGQGWQIDTARTKVDHIPMTRPLAYDLPVNKLVAAKQYKDENGQLQTISGLFVYWYVDDAHVTASPVQWQWVWMPQDLLLHGRLQRWSYVSVFTACPPGQEDLAYERIKAFINATIPEFQLTPRENPPLAVATPSAH
ncbi:MAG TPA: exosortase-associated EpsI family protein [Verrucomicrobiae bacterium]